MFNRTAFRCPSAFISPLLALLVGCTATATTSEPSEGPAVAPDGGGGGAPGPAATADGGSDARDDHEAPNGTVSFTVNGRTVVASRITLEESSGFYTLTASKDDNDGLHFERLSLQYEKGATGSSECGGFLSPGRSVTYGRYFIVNGQVATDKQYLSGLPGPSAGPCTFTVTGHGPEAGTVDGMLSSEKVLIGGGSVPPPVSVKATWAGVSLR